MLREASSIEGTAATSGIAPAYKQALYATGSSAANAQHFATQNMSILENTQPGSLAGDTTKRTEGTAGGGGLGGGRSRRVRTRSPFWRYRQLQTENIKFPRFLEVLFESKMNDTDLKNEIKGFVQAQETMYCNKLKDLRREIDLEKRLRLRADSQKVNEISEKNELEGVFVDCIEEVRKELASKRRGLKKPTAQRSAEEAKEFEDSLVKLAQLARKRTTIESFIDRDRSNLLDLFVNNEKTLLKIYEALFPHRTSHIADKTRGRFRGGGAGAGYGGVGAANKSLSHYGSLKDDVVMQHLPLARGVSEEEGRGGARRSRGSAAGGTKLPALGLASGNSREEEKRAL